MSWLGRGLRWAAVASAAFLIVAVSAFRMSPTDQGVGGFDLLAESSQPIYENLNSVAGRKELLADKAAYISEDTRTADGAKKACGGTYPATSLYMQTSYVEAHKDVVQKLVNVYVATLKWIQGHSAAEIADKMPADYYAGVGKPAYVAALNSEKGIYNPTGIMPADGPKTCLTVLSAFNPAVKGKAIDLAKTYTNQFVQSAQPLT